MIAPVTHPTTVAEPRPTVPLLRWGAFAAILAAVLITPGWILSVIQESEGASWTIIFAHMALTFALMAVFAVQASRVGRLGEIGFVLAIFGNMMLIATMLSALTVQARLGQRGLEHFIASGSVMPQVAAAGLLSLSFLLGMVLFGIATIRAGVFPRRAGQLVIVGVVGMFAGAVPDITGLEAAGTIALFAAFAWMGWQFRQAPAAGAD
jgi:hypothetical protein